MFMAFTVIGLLLGFWLLMFRLLIWVLRTVW